ncbi:MAG TPA: helix-turn-helix domain-containing protein [Nevskiaceae bacterium]
MTPVAQRPDPAGADRRSNWERSMDESFGCDVEVPPRFRGSVSTTRVGQLQVSRVSATSHEAQRTRRRIVHDRKNVVLVNVVTAGSFQIRQDGRTAMLGRGDLAIHDSTRPYTLLFNTSFSQVILEFPRLLLKQRLGSFERYTALRIGNDDDVGSLTGHFLAGVARVGAQVDEGTAQQLSVQAVDMLALALARHLRDVSPSASSSHRAALLYRAKTFVDTHLQQPLTLSAVSRVLGCSTRYVCSLFADEHTTLSEYVRARRLERCAHNLVYGPCSQQVSEIAYAWGFNSAAHFCRSFRSQFGMSPTEYRGQHQRRA